ncbi:MAG: histidinol-phosphate transaminase [bacterium]
MAALDLAKLVPEHLRSLSPYLPGRAIAEIQREYGLHDVVKLASNENPLGMSPHARAALVAVADEAHRYPEGGSPNLRAALALKHGLPEDRILLGNGSNEILTLLARLLLTPGDEVVVAAHAFAVYTISARAQGARVVTVPAPRFAHEPRAMATAVTERTKIVYLCNPNNPTGTMFGRTEWEAFFAAVPDDVLIVNDNAYAEYVEDPDYPDALAERDRHPGMVVLRTFSKIHGLAGLRVGWGVGPTPLVELYDSLRDPFHLNLAAERAATAALVDDEHVERSRRVNREGREFLMRVARTLGLPALPGAGNFLTIEVGDAVFVAGSLERAGVIVRPLGGYGMPAHIRVSIGLPAENTIFAQTLAALLGISGPGVPLLHQEASQ